MILELEDELRIVVDRYSVNLEKKTTRKKGRMVGKSVWVADSYHGNLAAALKAYVSRRLRDLTDLKKLVKVEKELRQKIDEIESFVDINPNKTGK